MNVHDFTVRAPNGEAVPLSNYAGKVLLVVNVASQCGFTPQYAGLEALYRKYRDRGFEVLAFPCNQFGKQEPGNAEEIASFCSLNYDVTFPLLAKIEVNGPNADPLYEHLKAARPGLIGTKAIKWNFTKFLVDRGGRVVARYAPTVKPEDLARDVEKLL
ncbi:MAG TPA: glutathione peroxidase [Rhizorhapis sp.]|nr:glutathione peroxidase [Rhizorhapis sp.]